MKSERDKTKERQKVLIDFIQTKLQREGKDTFSCNIDEISQSHTLFNDQKLVEKTLRDIESESKGNLEYEINRTTIQEQSSTASGPSHYDVSLVIIWVHVKNLTGLENQKESIEKEIAEASDKFEFILESDGSFYLEGTSKKHKFRGGKNVRRKLLTLLANNSGFISTRELVGLCDVEGEKEIYGAVEEIRTLVAKKWGLPRKVIFESSTGDGYRVTNVTLKNG